MKPTTKKSTAKLNAAIAPAIRNFKPPEDLTVAEWADRHRRLSPENSAESGPWRTSRTPYLREPMEAFTDPKIRKIVMVAASQVGKSELELNIIGYIIDQDPGSILFVQPSLDDARKFSRLRIAPMIRESVPHFGISWYKDGGILTRPTIFGAAGNNLLAGGEAGAEAVVPLATLWDKLELSGCKLYRKRQY